MWIFALWIAVAFAASQQDRCWSDTTAKEAISRLSTDQEARSRFLATGMKKDEELRVLAIDADNATWLRAQVRQCGWPQRSRVGEAVARSAWLLAQHADMAPDFQLEAAKAMKARVLEGEASGHLLALLVDRHARLQKLPQTYGMQFRLQEGKMVFLLIDDPENLDERRSAIGLLPFACHAEGSAKEQSVPFDWPAGVPRRNCASH